MKKLFLLIMLFVPFVLQGQTWMEIPAQVPGGGPYVTTRTTLAGNEMRSFTYRYDSERKVALWVAYPLNIDLIGSGSRGEGWLPDPALPESVQPALYKGFRYGSGYDRGHQIPSADRLDPKANEQTFRFTNATPQLHDFNGGLWAELEKHVRTWARRCDTLYVVTGIIPGNDWIEDNNGNPVNIPSAYYKAFLRRFQNRNKKVFWSGGAVLLQHKVYPVGNWNENADVFRQNSLSLIELEALTHETYFPLLENVVGKEDYMKIKSEPMRDQELWWR